MLKLSNATTCHCSAPWLWLPSLPPRRAHHNTQKASPAARTRAQKGADAAEPHYSIPHHAAHLRATHPSSVSPTLELGGSHSASLGAPLSNAVELFGCYRIIGPAIIMKTKGGSSLEAFLGAGAMVQICHPDADIVVMHEVSLNVGIKKASF